MTLLEKTPDEIRELVRDAYARAASSGGCGCSGCGDTCGTEDDWGAARYDAGERSEVPERAALASLGCGNPTAVAELHEGEVVLDLGSGGGLDVLLSARRVGTTGRAYGLDMTPEMLELARRNAREAGATNVEFLAGVIEDVPLPDASVDVIISNCVVNLSPDKERVFREAARILRPGGRIALTDIVADPELDAATRRDPREWTGCLAGALTQDEFESTLAAAGFVDVEVRETHRVHEHAGSAIVRARKPPAPADARG